MAVNVHLHCLVASALVTGVDPVFPLHVMKPEDLPMLIDHVLISLPSLCYLCRDCLVCIATRHGWMVLESNPVGDEIF
jgi:hypothetical protein